MIILLLFVIGDFSTVTAAGSMGFYNIHSGISGDDLGFWDVHSSASGSGGGFYH